MSPILSVLLLFITWHSTNASDDPQVWNRISLTAGGYSYSTVTSTIAGAGLLSIAYQRLLEKNWAISIDSSYVYTSDSMLGSSVKSTSLCLESCLLGCNIKKMRAGNTKISERSHYETWLGLGINNSQIDLDNSPRSWSGPTATMRFNFWMTRNVGLVIASAFSSSSKASESLISKTLTTGIIYGF